MLPLSTRILIEKRYTVAQSLRSQRAITDQMTV